jgi:sugar phosphate isomerase/epimerase
VRQGDIWKFSPIGEGMIDYRAILSAIARDSRPLPVSLEIPLRLARAADASPIRAAERVDLDRIRKVMKQSMAFVRRTMIP